MKRNYIKASTENSKFAEYVDYLDGIAYKYGIRVSGDSPETLSFYVEPDGQLPSPTIQVAIELDSDGETDYTYFMPIVTLPELDSTQLDYADTIHYLLNTWADNIGKFCKELINTPYRDDKYIYVDDEDY